MICGKTLGSTDVFFFLFRGSLAGSERGNVLVGLLGGGREDSTRTGLWFPLVGVRSALADCCRWRQACAQDLAVPSPRSAIVSPLPCRKGTHFFLSRKK